MQQQFLKNYQKQNQISRCFQYKNLHEVPFIIEKITLFYTLQKDVSLKSLTRISTLLELITDQRATFIRAQKASLFLKIRKGSPLGVKVTLRKKILSNFLLCLIWEILPNIKNFSLKTKLLKIKQAKVNNIAFILPDPLVFSVLKSFFFLFRSCNNLKILTSFDSRSSRKECFFNARFVQIPV